MPSLILFCLIYPRHDFAYYSNVNESARIYLVMAAVDQGVLHIDDGIKRFGDVIDKAEHGGHFYCDKPIGLSLVAVPVYAILKALGAVTGHQWTLGELRYLLTVVCVSLPTVILCIVLRRYWRNVSGDPLLVEFAIIAYALGTIAFTYGTQFMGHQLAAVLAAAHFLLARGVTEQTTIRRAAAMGMLAGLGAITEYFSALVHVIIALSYLRRMRPWSAWGVWAVSGIIAACPLLIYNAVCFGGPFTMAYGHEAARVFQEVHGTGYMGVTYPRMESVWGLLFSPSKGLFFLSPFLLIGVAGILPAFRSRRSECMVIVLSIGAIMLLAMSVYVWRAGRTIGPRHMVTMLPFLMTLVVLGVGRWPALRPWFVAGTIVSIVVVGLSTLTLPGFEENFENPFASQTLFLLKRNLVTPTIGLWVGLRGWASLLPVGVAVFGSLVALGVWARREKRRLASWGAACAAALSLAWFGFVATYEPDHPAVRTLFQGRTLGLLGEFRESSEYLERAIDLNPTVEFLQETVPQLLLNYGQLGDEAAKSRLEQKVRRIEAGESRPRG
ncbi:MAG: hypothetical protein HZA51_06410 [Planctomycetes bacterium]|nr:hypothetical protein [Planctomycetota bacterium]